MGKVDILKVKPRKGQFYLSLLLPLLPFSSSSHLVPFFVSPACSRGRHDMRLQLLCHALMLGCVRRSAQLCRLQGVGSRPRRVLEDNRTSRPLFSPRICSGSRLTQCCSLVYLLSGPNQETPEIVRPRLLLCSFLPSHELKLTSFPRFLLLSSPSLLVVPPALALLWLCSVINYHLQNLATLKKKKGLGLPGSPYQ